MDYAEFKEIAEGLGYDFSDTDKPEPYGRRYISEEMYDLGIKIDGHYVQHETGGYSGGSCWNDDAPRPYTSNSAEPDFDVIDKILENTAPDISFMKYRAIREKVLKVFNHTEFEYYGNSTNYKVWAFSLKDLYDALVEIDYWSAR